MRLFPYLLPSLAVWFLSYPCLCAGLEVKDKNPEHELVYVSHAENAWVLIDPVNQASGIVPSIADVDSKTCVFVAPPGRYLIRELYRDEANKNVINRKVIEIEDSIPTPSPDPSPAPDPAPDPAPGAPFKAMIIYESGAPVTAFQSIRSQTVRRYLNEHTPQDSRGLPSWRLWDDDYKDSELVGESPEMVALYKQARQDSKGKVPWIVISGTTVQESRPLPETEAETLTLLKKYGGA